MRLSSGLTHSAVAWFLVCKVIGAVIGERVLSGFRPKIPSPMIC